MTPAQKTLRELRDTQSKHRQRMAELAATELTDETRSELDAIEKETPDLERRIRAATVAQEDEERDQKVKESAAPDPEMRERVELRSKARLTNFVQAALAGRQVTGPEAELRAAAGVTGIPLELWDVPRPENREKDREDRVATPAPGTVGINLDPIRPQVFSRSIAPMLGIEMPRVMSGTYATGTISTGITSAARAKGANQAATAAAITVQTATPKRVSARLELRIEDIAAIGTDNFEAILRENTSLALSDALDDQMINGNGTAPNLAGIFQQLTDPAAPGDDVATFDDFIAAFANGIDGLWAGMTKEVAIVAPVNTYRLSARTFRDAAGEDLGAVSFAEYAKNLFGAWWTNERMPAGAQTEQAILYRMGRSMMGGSMGMRTAVCPHWADVSIDDIYSGSASGTRSFNLHVILGDVLLVQPDAYSQVAFRHTAAP